LQGTYLPKNGSGNLDEEDEPPEGEYDRQPLIQLWPPKCSDFINDYGNEVANPMEQYPELHADLDYPW